MTLPTSPSATDMPLRPLSQMQQAAIAFGTVSMGASMSIAFVVVSPLARDAGLSEIQVAGILAISTLMFTFMIPVWGRLADRYGRKPIMVFSLLMMALTNAAFIFALNAALMGIVTGLSAFFLLAFVRFWFGVLGPGLQPASMAAMADATTPRTRAAGMGLLGAGMSLGIIVGPAGAVALARFGPLMPIWGAVALSAIAGLVIALILPRTHTGVHSERPDPLPLRDKRLFPVLVFLLAYFATVSGVQQTIAWLITDRYGLERTEAIQGSGLVLTSMGIMLMIVQFAYIARKKPSPYKMLPAGLVMVAAGYLVTVLAPSLAFMCLGFAIVGIGAAFCVPSLNAIGTLSVLPEEQGAASALLSAAPPAGYIIGPVLASGLYMLHHALPLSLAALMIAVLGGLAYRRWRPAPA